LAEREAAAVAPKEDGYALVRRALAARGADPEMEYAAALVSRGRHATRVAAGRRKPRSYWTQAFSAFTQPLP